MLQIILPTEAEWNGIFFLGIKSVSTFGVKRVRFVLEMCKNVQKCAKKLHLQKDSHATIFGVANEKLLRFLIFNTIVLNDTIAVGYDTIVSLNNGLKIKYFTLNSVVI